VRTIGSVDRGLFASSAYLERRGMPQRLADLTVHDVIAFRGDGHGERLRLQGPHGIESIVVHGRVETDAFAFVFECVRLGVGIGLLPLGGCVTHLRLERVLPELTEPGYPVSIVYPSSRHLPQRVRLLRDALIVLFTTEKLHLHEAMPPATASRVIDVAPAASAH
jgi:DNA-binding transcriptional LysR family regulator